MASSLATCAVRQGALRELARLQHLSSNNYAGFDMMHLNLDLVLLDTLGREDTGQGRDQRMGASSRR